MPDEPYHPSERRPIAARELRVFRRAAGWLARRHVSPNAISVAGMFCGVAAGAALFLTSYHPGWRERFGFLAAAALIQLRLLANMLDGMVAIESSQASPVGELYNEVPDRISDAATLIGLGYAAGGDVVLGYAAAGVAVFTAYIRAAGKVAGAAQAFCGPMAKPQRMFTVTVVALYCGLMPADWQPAWGAAAGSGDPRLTWGDPRQTWGLPAAALGLVILGGLWTALRRLRRIAAALSQRAA